MSGHRFGAWGGCLALALCALIWQGCPSTPEPSAHQAEQSAPDEVSVNGPSDDPVVAQVGPGEIRLSALLAATKPMEERYRRAEAATAESVCNLRREKLDEMVERRLLLLGCLRDKVEVSSASTEAEVKRRQEQLGTSELERRRKLNGLSEAAFDEQFRQFVREELLIHEFLQLQVYQQLAVTDEAVREYYDTHQQDLFKRPQSWSVWHLERYAPRTAPDQATDARLLVEQLHSEVSRLIVRATGTAEKADLVRPFVEKYSQAEGNSGSYAFIYDIEGLSFDPALLSRVKDSQIGDLSPVFELAGDTEKTGYAFFYVFEQRPSEQAPFERVAGNIRKDLLHQQRQDRLARLFEDLKEDFEVHTYDDVLCEPINSKGSGS